MEAEPVPMCPRCNRQFHDDETVRTMGITLHTTCLNCDKCGVNLIKGFHHNSGRFYCSKCVTSLVPICAGCKKIIGFGRSVKALDSEWHINCIVCDICKKVFDGGRHYPFNGKPYCLQDYWNSRVEHEQQVLGEQALSVEKPKKERQKTKIADFVFPNF